MVRRNGSEMALAASYQPLSTFKTSDNCTIAFRMHNAASDPSTSRLVLIHPLALNQSVWDSVIGILEQHTSLLAYDCRGHGASERRKESFTIELFARDLLELLDYVGWHTAIVAGCSMGGCIAQSFAAQYSPRVDGLGLIDTTAWYGPNSVSDWKRRADAAISEGLRSRISFQATRWFSDEFRSANSDILGELTEIFLANDPECYKSTCLMLGNVDLRAEVKQIQVPVAIVVGEQDYATPAAMSKHLHEAIPNSTLEIIENARHLTPVESSLAVASELMKLIDRSQETVHNSHRRLV